MPEYEISANQTLSDLNWTDFFGSRKTVEATRLVVRIKQVLGQSGPRLLPLLRSRRVRPTRPVGGVVGGGA